MTFLAQFQQGTVFAGEFEVKQPLKEGGMGAVYIARQLSTDKLRALKLMQPQLVREPSLRKRFEHEARVGARIKSRHVVEVIGAGVDEKTGLPWLAMELLEGMDLESRVRSQGALTPAELRQVFEQLCHAMGEAHQAGIVHRDLKPENIFLAQSQQVGNAWMIKVLDFGIAKIREESQDNKTTAAIGTAAYMAPEQTTPGHAISPAADVWALGLIAFFVLTGKQYWRQANLRPNSALGILREVAYEPLVPPTARAAELGCTQTLPSGFDDWFGRCVAREIDSRYANADEAFRALAPLLEDGLPALSARVSGLGSRSIAAPSSIVGPGTTPQPLRTELYEKRRIVGLFAVGACVLGAVIGIAALGRARLPVELPFPPAPSLVMNNQTHSDPAAASPRPASELAGSIGAVPSQVAPLAVAAPAAEKKNEPASTSSTPPPSSSATKERPAAAKRSAPVLSAAERRCRETVGTLRTACEESDNARACHALGDMFEKGMCAAKKPTMAKVMWKRGCTLGDASACQHSQ